MEEMLIALQVLVALGAILGVWASYWTYVNNKRMEVFQIYVEKFNTIITPNDVQWWGNVMQNQRT